MDSEKKNSYPREVRTTVEILLDTEKKIEKLRLEVEMLSGQDGPKPSLRPTWAVNEPIRNIAGQKTEKLKQIEDLANRTLKITELIEKGSDKETGKRISRLKEEWLSYIEPPQSKEDKALFASQKKASRLANKDWEVINHSDVQKAQSKFEENKVEIDGRRLSYLDKARGLQADYAYLETPEPEPGKDPNTPEINEPEID